MVTSLDIDKATHRADKRGARVVKAYVFGKENDDLPAGATKTLPESDVFQVVADKVVTPPFDLYALAKMPELCSEMLPAIEAMEANIGGFGYRLTSLLAEQQVDDKSRKEIRAERIFLQNFFDRVAVGESFTSLRRRTRRDLETTGNAYWEVIRGLNGQITGLKHIPSYQVRLSYEDKEFTPIKVPHLVTTIDGKHEIEERLVYKRFRRFVQGQSYIVSLSGSRTVSGSSANLRWFKQFGDPRVVDNATGEYVSPENVADWNDSGKPMPEAARASELIHWKIYSPRTPYGLPRYVGSLLSVLGIRAAEEVNYTTLKNNNIPSMIISVSGGKLTEASIQRIEEFAEVIAKGMNYSRFLLLEGESEYESEDSGHVKVSIDPLTDKQHKDALFVEYMAASREAVRRSWRLPPILVGQAEAYNRATAEASRKLADEQVFGPERDEEDWTINNTILADLGVRFHKFESRTPNVTDNRELISMLSAAERTGGITPRIARSIVEDVFGTAAEAPELDPGKFDPDVPFSLTMAEAVKNTGGAAGPTEVNQTIAPVQPPSTVKSEYDRALIKRLMDLGDKAEEEVRRLLRDESD